MVEMVIMLAMLVLVASIVLASFPRLSSRIRLQRSAQLATLALRRAQNMAFAVRQVQSGNNRIIPPAYGVSFNRSSPTSYVLFADIAGSSGTGDGIYTAGTDVVVESIPLDPGISVSQITSDLGGANHAEDVLNVTFSVPEARMQIAAAAVGSVGESAEVDFVSPVGATRGVIVRTSGQIRVK